MLITLNRHSGVPTYRQIIDQIRFGIASGLLAPEEEMPSTRSLSAELGSNPMTISKAYGMLEREGLLLRRPGLPLIVSPMEGGQAADSSSAKQRRETEFLRALEPVASIARRLRISPTRARALLGQAMNDTETNEEAN